MMMSKMSLPHATCKLFVKLLHEPKFAKWKEIIDT